MLTSCLFPVDRNLKELPDLLENRKKVKYAILFDVEVYGKPCAKIYGDFFPIFLRYSHFREREAIRVLAAEKGYELPIELR